MYKKRFYRANGSERKRKCRERQVTAKLTSELNDSAAPSTNEFDHSNDALAVPPIVEQHSRTENEMIDDRAIDFHRMNIEERNDDEANHDDHADNGNDDDNDYDDCDDADVDVQDLFHSLNNSRRKKLHSSTYLSVYDGCMEIIKTSQDLNLNKFQINRLLESIRVLLPVDNKLPRTISGLFKVVGKYL